jgi:hypothetical protein
MFSSLANTFLLISFSYASPLSKRQDNTQPVGTNPITNFTVEYLGEQTAENSCSHRDLGFTGSIAGNWYAVFGDTLWCAAGVTDPAQDPSGFHGMVRDSISATTDSALKVIDLNLNDDSPVPHQLQFVPFNAAWGEDNTYGFGGTSLVETDATSATGAIFYLVVRSGHFSRNRCNTHFMLERERRRPERRRRWQGSSRQWKPHSNSALWCNRLVVERDHDSTIRRRCCLP